MPVGPNGPAPGPARRPQGAAETYGAGGEEVGKAGTLWCA